MLATIFISSQLSNECTHLFYLMISLVQLLRLLINSVGKGILFLIDRHHFTLHFVDHLFLVTHLQLISIILSSSFVQLQDKSFHLSQIANQFFFNSLIAHFIIP